MSKTKSLTDLVTELQHENDRLKCLDKLFNRACKNEFGYDVSTIHQILEKQRFFEQRITEKQGQHTTISVQEM